MPPITIDRHDISGSFKSLTAAVATATGNTVKFPVGLAEDFTLQVVLTGSPTTSVDLEGSLDGTNFFVMATQANAGYKNVVQVPVRYVRAKLNTLSGGTSPTVTAIIAWSS